jgi:hypothetical protein
MQLTTVVAPRTDIAVLMTRHHVSEVVALGAYGRRDGYTSLDAAINAMRGLTTGDTRKGVAILERDGRFFAQRALEKVVDNRFSARLNGRYLNVEQTSGLQIAGFNRNPALRALVDGAKVVR